jgi:signal peptidase I
LKRLTWAINAAVLASWFFSVWIADRLPGALSLWTPSILLVVYLVAIWGLVPSARLRLHTDRSTVVAAVAGVAFVLVLFEPVFIVPHIFVTLTAMDVAREVVYAVLYGLFLQVFLFGLNTRISLDRRTAGTLLIPFALDMVLLIPLGTLQPLLGALPQQQFSFVVGDLFGGATLFVVLVLLYAKSRFNNLPGFLFYLAATVPTVLSVIVFSNSALQLAWPFAAYGIALLLITLLLPTTWAERRLFSPERAPRFTSAGRGTYVAVGAVVALVVVLLLVIPAALGTPHPYYADATGSMVPQIYPGSLLIVRHVNVNSITVGEVLVFTAAWAGNITVAHQVVGILRTSSGLEFRTKGIANPAPDPAPTPAANVIGVVALVIPGVGYLVLYSYLVLLVTVVGVTGYLVYSAWHPRRARFRVRRGWF